MSAAVGAVVRSGRENMQPERVAALLHVVPWGRGRPLEQIIRELESSLCFGVFLPDSIGMQRQVGFARAYIDSNGVYHLCDVVIEQTQRGRGLGTLLIQTVVEDERLRGRFGTLETEHAHRLYEKVGFERCGRERMLRRPL